MKSLIIARLLKAKGYATACIGKWRLGDQPPFLPTRHGFDHYFGIPYSDDMDTSPPLPLMRGEKAIEAPVDRDYLTQRYAEETLRLITENRDRPFFIYLPYAMPGSTDRPFASPVFLGKSANGPDGDSIEEMDWSTGEILVILDRRGLDDNTLVVWTSATTPRAHSLQAKATDAVGNEGVDDTVNVTVEAAAPTVSITSISGKMGSKDVRIAGAH